MINTLKAWIALFRAEHALLICIAIAFSQYITGTNSNLIYFIAPILAQFSAFAINDYLDAETDKLNKRIDRPIVMGLVKKEQALYAGVLTLILSLIAALFLPFIPMVIVFIFNVLSILYNLRLKDYPLIGEFYIAASMAIPFIYGAAFSHITTPIIIITISVFLFGIGREIIKKAEDMLGDKKVRDARTLPLLIGVKNAVNVAVTILLLSFVIFVIVFFLFFTFNAVSILFFVLTFIVFLQTLHFALKDNYKMARTASLILMFFALVTLFFGVFV